MIETKRLILRLWKKEDYKPFAVINADPRVMEYFPKPLSQTESDQLATRIQTDLEKQGWGLWAAMEQSTEQFIGFIGLDPVSPSLPFAPATEVGWRLSFNSWGKGYATEGATACLHYAFQTLELPEIVSFTAENNLRSRRVMERIGMHHDPQDDFDHPKLPEGHPLKRHVLYRITNQRGKSPA
ncbi:MAG: GNAT family N-acetyltransferase [Chlamydiia bacterium]|nr:GNAT family N-acetyltransferase [Chlamydiia bacterium]